MNKFFDSLSLFYFLDCLITPEEDQEEISERTGPNVISLVIQSSINQKSKKTMQIGKVLINCTFDYIYIYIYI